MVTPISGVAIVTALAIDLTSSSLNPYAASILFLVMPGLFVFGLLLIDRNQGPSRQGLPNVILTPHIGGSTSEAQAAIGREVVSTPVKFVTTGATTGAVNFPVVEVAQLRGTRRILNVHRNVPGVLRDINKIVSDLNANVRSQMLATDPNIGYLVMDIDQDVSTEVDRGIAALPTNIRTRIL